jgi:hypothetical protein
LTSLAMGSGIRYLYWKNICSTRVHKQARASRLNMPALSIIAAIVLDGPCVETQRCVHTMCPLDDMQ